LIFNQDLADMPIGADFNVVVPAVDLRAFVHTATADNVIANRTVISHPLLDDNPGAIVHVTPNWNPGGTDGTYNDHPIGIYYENDRWWIFNQDLAAVPVDADFNVVVPPSSLAFVHTATASNVSANNSAITHPLLDGNPNAVAHVTQNWNATGTPGIYNNHPIGVYYTGGGWRIFNQDLAAMPFGADFNISALPVIFADGFESGDVSAW
jgi:hypothetical protein